MTDHQLDLVIPGLFGPFPDLRAAKTALASIKLPGLNSLLSQAHHQRQPKQDPTDAQLAIELLAGQYPDSPDPSTAKSDALLAATGDQLTPHKHWYRIDPVHLHPDRDRILLLDRYSLNIQAHQAQALVEALNHHFAQDGWEICAPRPEHWYLSLPQALNIQCHNLGQAVARPIDQHLPQGPDQTHWNRLLCEAQMVLHNHPINAQRQAQGQHPINSLWLDDGHHRPRFSNTRYRAIHTNAAAFRGAAMLAGIQHHTEPSHYQAKNHPGRQLIVLETARAASHYADLGQWIEALLTLEEHWFQALAEPSPDSPQTLRLIDLQGNRWQISKRNTKTTIAGTIKQLMQRLRPQTPTHTAIHRALQQSHSAE